MGLWDKIKKFFNRGKNDIKALPEAQSNQRNPYESSITLRRNDGTTIMITPMLDKVGNQLYKSVLNHNTGEMQYIPEYRIADNALANAQTIHGSTMASIYMDIDMNLLRDETYNYYIADVLLSPQRMAEIIDDNQHYAGGMNIGEAGEILGYYSDDGIIQGLKANALENAQKYAEVQSEKDKAYTEEAYRNAAKISPSIETNGEQVLSPDMDPYR